MYCKFRKIKLCSIPLRECYKKLTTQSRFRCVCVRVWVTTDCTLTSCDYFCLNGKTKFKMLSPFFYFFQQTTFYKPHSLRPFANELWIEHILYVLKRYKHKLLCLIFLSCKLEAQQNIIKFWKTNWVRPNSNLLNFHKPNGKMVILKALLDWTLIVSVCACVCVWKRVCVCVWERERLWWKMQKTEITFLHI